MRSTFGFGVAVFLLVLTSMGAVSAAETWLQCEGAITTVGADNKPVGESKSAKDVYAYDDTTRHLFRYSEARKVLDLVFVEDYGQSQIRWSSPTGTGYGDVRWEGVLDRGAMTLKLTRKEKGETMTWAETCKPIQPLS